MRMIVFGAAGRIGRLAVAKAIGHGHHVTAFVTSGDYGPDHERLSVVRGDVLKISDVLAAVAGIDAVVFAIEPSSRTAGLHERGIANVIQAMATNRVYRLSVLSSIGAFGKAHPQGPLDQRILVATLMRATVADLEAMELRVMASDLDWTIVRPMKLTDEDATGHYRYAFDDAPLSKTKSIPRADVASLLVKAVETETYWRRRVVVAR